MKVKSKRKETRIQTWTWVKSLHTNGGSHDTEGVGAWLTATGTAIVACSFVAQTAVKCKINDFVGSKTRAITNCTCNTALGSQMATCPFLWTVQQLRLNYNFRTAINSTKMFQCVETRNLSSNFRSNKGRVRVSVEHRVNIILRNHMTGRTEAILLGKSQLNCNVNVNSKLKTLFLFLSVVKKVLK